MEQPNPTHQKVILEIVDKLLDRFYPKSNNDYATKSSKFKYFILIIFGFFVFDYFSRFTENLSIVRKVEYVKAINSVVNDPKIDSITKMNLIAQERVVSNRQSWQSHFNFFISRAYINISSTIENSDIANPNNSIKRSNFIHILSSNWALILLSLVAFFHILATKEIQFKDKLLILVFFILSVFLTVLAISYFFALIPVFQNPIWNYLINATLSPLLTFLTILFYQRMEKIGYL